MKMRLIPYLCVGIVGAALIAVYAAVDPAQAWFMPKCVFHELTGLECPGCGSQRMFHALLQGRFAEAWGHNAFVMVAFPVAILLLVAEYKRKRWPRLHRQLHSPWAIGLCLVLIVGWTFYSNLR